MSSLVDILNNEALLKQCFITLAIFVPIAGAVGGILLIKWREKEDEKAWWLLHGRQREPSLEEIQGKKTPQLRGVGKIAS